MKKNKIYLLALLCVAIVVVLALSWDSLPFIGAEGMDFEERLNHYKPDTDIMELNWFECTPGDYIWIEVYEPDDTQYMRYEDTAQGETFVMNVDVYLDIVGVWTCEYGVEELTYYSGTFVHVDPFVSHTVISDFTVSPRTVKPGDTVSWSISITNDGDLDGSLSYVTLFNDRLGMGSPYPNAEIWFLEESGISLNVGESYSEEGTFVVDADNENPEGIVRVALWCEFNGDAGSYPPEWCTLVFQDYMLKEIIYESIQTYTLTVNTVPSECTVVIASSTYTDTKTSFGGTAVFTDLDEDTYNVAVSKTGYTSQDLDVLLNYDKTVAFTLREEGGGNGGIPGFELVLVFLSIFLILWHKKRRNEK